MSFRSSPTFRILAWVLSFGLLAGLISCLVGYGIAFKWFAAWHALPALPEPAQSIAGATVDTVYVQAGAGSFFRCDVEEPETCWIPVDMPQTVTDEPCEPYNRARPLRQVIDQRLVCRNYADGGDTALYALRSDGLVYAWRAADSAYDALLIFLCPAFCAPLGLLAGLVVGLLRNRKKAARTDAGPAMDGSTG